MKAILSANDLSSRLGIPLARLYEIADDVKPHYKLTALPDKKDKTKIRMLRVPAYDLKDIQKRIRINILDHIDLDDGVHGGVRGRSPRTNAKDHLGQRCVINLDVKKFFPKIRHYIVYRMFHKDLGFGRDVARLLTRLTTYDGQVPQGAPTSTAIANVLLSVPVDGPVTKRAKSLNVRYTRFVDDVTFSGSNPRPLINLVGRTLSKRRLPMYRPKKNWSSKPKFKITPRSEPQEVTGLLVNSRKDPSVSRQRRDKVRAAIFALRKCVGEGNAEKAVRSIRGQILHVRQFNPGSAKRLQRGLDAALNQVSSAPGQGG